MKLRRLPKSRKALHHVTIASVTGCHDVTYREQSELATQPTLQPIILLSVRRIAHKADIAVISSGNGRIYSLFAARMLSNDNALDLASADVCIQEKGAIKYQVRSRQLGLSTLNASVHPLRSL